MPRYAALLGSINVGGNRLEMADLRAAMEQAGFANAATVVASGNVLFDHAQTADAKLAAVIAQLVAERFGIETFAAVRTKAELEAALAQSPFAGAGEDKFVNVMFLERQPTHAEFAALVEDHAGRGAEKIVLGDRALHIDFASGVAGSKLTGAFVARRLGCRGTARNLRSLKRIIEKFA